MPGRDQRMVETIPERTSVMVIDVLRPEQAAAIARLEALNFSKPWSEEAILTELENPYAVTLVASDETVVAGYINAHCVFENAHINTFCVAEKNRKKGVGQQLLNAVMNFAARHGAEEITLEVRKSNCAALSLYKKSGFSVAGQRKNFYRNPTEDAWILKKMIKENRYDESTGMGR